MWKAPTKLFENNTHHKNLALKDKLRNIKMQKNDIVLQYLSRFTQFWDDLGGVGVNVAEYDLVILALLSLPKS